MSTLVQTQLAGAIRAALVTVGVTPPGEISLERPAKREHGDWSSNAALVTAKLASRNPRELAAGLADVIKAALPPHVTAVEVAGPGFLNFRLADSWLHEVLSTVVAQGEQNYARLATGDGTRLIVEYVSGNPTGPLHAGHARWAAYGDALSRVLSRCGYVVTREFYVNDRGVQMEKYAASLLARKNGTEVPEGGYPGQYVIDWAKEMPAGVDALEWGLEKATSYQRDTMARMNVVFDVWTSERAIAARGDVEKTLADLRNSGHVYEGAAAEGLGADDDEASPDQVGSAVWLRTSDFGDDKDRVLVKADGTYTYFMPDIAFHRDKFSRADQLIDILGADHHGYVRRMKAAMQCLGHDPSQLEILIGQHCVLLRAGEEVRLSRRSGDFIELADIIDEVGPDAAKLTFLLQSIDTRQMVDLALVASTSLDNPVHYIHYAHARVHGIGRKAAEQGVVRVPLGEADLSLLSNDYELDVLRSLAELPDVVALAARDRAPHKVTTWVRELAGAFQSFYQHGKVLHPDVSEPQRQARLWLVESARIGLAIGLDLLGVSAPEQMERLDDEGAGARGVGSSVVSPLADNWPFAPGAVMSAAPADVVAAVAAVAAHAAADSSTAGVAGATGMAGPISLHLLPETATIGDNGQLSVGGRNVVELAEEFGTPLFVYDEFDLRARCRESVWAYGNGVAYASKAFLCRAMARLAHEEGMHVDVASSGEAFTALRAGVPADRLVMHGNNKSTSELTYALERGIGRIVVDSLDELDRLKRLAGFGHPRPKVLLRITPGVEIHTHEFIATGHEDVKFGFSLASGAAMDAVMRSRAEGSGIELVGLHCHVGSQVFDVDAYEKLLAIIAPFFGPLGLPELVIGGGLGVAYVETENAPTISAWGAIVKRAAQDAGISGAVRLTAEPGRAIVARAGMTLYRVGTIKDLPGIRTYVSVDGGMSDNPRPVLYGSGYEAFLPRAANRARTRAVRVVGKHCESGDLLIREAFVNADLQVGDVLATPVTGAYGYAMASNYNKLPRPAVVFVNDGQARVVVRRETYEDLVRLDVD